MKILFVGDICTYGNSYSDIDEFKNTNLFNYLNTYDGFIIGNLEAPILSDDVLHNADKVSLKNTPDLFDLYDFCDGFTLANNHMFDQGIEGYQITKSYLHSKNKQIIGAGLNIDEARKPLIIDRDGFKVALLSYCCYSSNSESYAKKSSSGVMPLVYQYLKDDIDSIRGDVDRIIILPHWGVENCFHPTFDQVAFARKVLELGADAIIGTHSHTIHSFENYGNKKVYYSLGNFFFNDYFQSQNHKKYQSKYNKEGMIVEIEVTKNGVNFEEKYFSQTTKGYPEFISKHMLCTKIDENNHNLALLTRELNHNRMNNDIGLAMKFNGKAMQVVNTSSILKDDYVIKYENFKTKSKRLVMNKLRTLIK